MRIDKWLWAARFFKARSLAAKACDLGRAAVNQQTAKPSREVRVGDSLVFKTEAGEFTLEIVALSEMRGPASVAQMLYHESETSARARLDLAAERKAMMAAGFLPEGKPSKRNRREFEQFRRRE